MSFSHLPGVRVAAGLAGALFLVAPAAADEPGPGGIRPRIPVTGEEVYRATCAACHMQDGAGGEGAARIPALARNPAVESSDYLLFMMANGRGAMPSFRRILTPAQMAGVSTYIRTHMGNAYGEAVTEADAEAALGAK